LVEMTCPDAVSVCPSKFQIFTRPSSPAVASKLPSGENASDQISQLLIPWSSLQGGSLTSLWSYSVHAVSDGGVTAPPPPAPAIAPAPAAPPVPDGPLLPPVPEPPPLPETPAVPDVPPPPLAVQPAVAVRGSETMTVEPAEGTDTVVDPEKQKPPPIALAETVRKPVALEGT
jgi:hypothetical protein